MAFKIIATLLILTVSLEMSSGSAIPIWEFLSRNEKISYLYSTFAKLVSDHCKTNTAVTRTVPVNHCKRDLLNYGYEKLQKFADHQLDTLDPYQRGANELIWTAMIRGHPAVTSVTTGRNPQSTQSPTSTVILSQQNHPSYPANPLFDEHEHKHTFAMDMDTAYGYAPPVPSSAEDRFSAQSTSATAFKQPTYLNGPFVFRVRPDGTPIEEDKHKPYPIDDDLEAFQVAKQSKLATISSIKQKRLATFASQHLTVQQQSSAQHQLQRDRRHSSVANKQYPSIVGTPYYNSRRLVLV